MNDQDDQNQDGQDEDDKIGHNSGGTIDTKLVETLADIAIAKGLAEIEVRQGKLRIRVARQLAQPHSQAGTPVAPVERPATASPGHGSKAAAAEHPGTVRSPMVGTIYLRPEPQASAFVEIGSAVQLGDKLMLIEAMKTFNDIVAPRAGTVTAILVNDGEPVEFGESLVIIE